MLSKSLVKFHLNGMVQMKQFILCFAHTLCQNCVLARKQIYSLCAFIQRFSCHSSFFRASEEEPRGPGQILFTFKVAQEEFALIYFKTASVAESYLLK